MSSYIFQGKTSDPTRFDPIDLRHEPAVGEVIWWNAQRYRSLMKLNDLVFFWQAGDADVRGIMVGDDWFHHHTKRKTVTR